MPYSAIFLCFNVFFMALYLFFDNFEVFEDVETMIKKFFKDDQKEQSLDNKVEEALFEEVERQVNDLNWKPTF